MGFVIKSSIAGEYLVCERPELSMSATHADEIKPLLERVEALQSEGYYVGGWLSYEAAKGFDDFAVHSSEFPLAVMLASREVRQVQLPYLEHQRVSTKAKITAEEYQLRYEALLDFIENGDIYQTNFSFRTDVLDVVDGFSLFCQLERNHPVPHAAFVEFENWQVVSSSPELFLQRQGNQIITEPMKGTVGRGLWYKQDEEQKKFLESDNKNRAENLMIVDLMRNDLGKISNSGTVTVPSLFESKRFASLHQLVSEVRGELRSDICLYDILEATFPAGSITGAPKHRAMEIIHELEESSRDAYTGSVGIFLPDGDFKLNVAIRTLTISNEVTKPRSKLGIGSGVVSPSCGESEWRECLLKAEFLNYERQHGEIFETILWENGEYFWLDEHLTRLRQSSEYFLGPYDEGEVRDRLIGAALEFAESRYRVRLAILNSGEINVAATPLLKSGWGESVKVQISDRRIDETSCYQYHKTDVRAHYDQGLKNAVERGFSEVLFMNHQEQIAEGAISNLFLKVAGRWLTPALESGLLPGIWREKTLQQLDAIPSMVSLETLQSAEKILLGNSVRQAGEVEEVWHGDDLLWSRSVETSRKKANRN